MCIKFKRILIVLLFLFIVVPANAGIVTITDDFDNSDKTADLWDASFGGSWDHIELTGPDLGYHGVANSESSGTAAFVANQQYFDIANLSMKTLVKIDGSDTDRKDVVAGFLFISGTITTGHYEEYTIILDIDYDDDPNILAPVRRLEVWHNNVTPSGETITKLKFRKGHRIYPFQNSAKIRKNEGELITPKLVNIVISSSYIKC